ncbi:response regulator transcription factor [Clostridium sp. P21]|uniref:Stage 0 sporulation protein A homolog n=1 Tax=Clostridium muellerianum TaxID=2716538 RepID=A0A7Y0HRP8_9CLOT|nr:LytTR family DNA-binding domain-containing protein [Clostridium muellerianum]NMM65431.1 response regulator transcription factor [Clostridium muellerianum]
MDKIKCIILEDEIPAAEELKYILSQYELIEVVGVGYDGQSGLELIITKKPEAVFMDINMPLQDGMELARKVRKFNESIEIVFVTAYEEHALQAFEVNALDYILKPFDEKRINITVNRLVNKFKSKFIDEKKLPNIINQIINKIDKEEKVAKKVPCEKNGKIILVDVKDVYYCYIKEEKTYVKAKGGTYLVSFTLQQIEGKTNFFRAHRSYLVNMDNIKELYSWFNGTYKLVMNDAHNSEIPISRNNVRKLKEMLGI